MGKPKFKSYVNFNRSSRRAIIAAIGLIVGFVLTSGCSGGTVTISLSGGGTPNVSVSNATNGGVSANNGSTGSTGPNGPAVQFGVQQKTGGCRPMNALPDSACTPGAVLNVTVSQICQSGYATSVRNVPTSEKDQVYKEYGISHHATGDFEVDHLVSLELGGSNDIANLWPEAALPKPGYHEKDKVENYLHDQVCRGAVSLPDAQHEIATNWLAVYQRMGGG